MTNLFVEEKLERLRYVFEMDKKSIVAEFGDIFYGYFEHILKGPYFPHLINRANYILELINKKNSNALDFGCGAGLWSILFTILGDCNNVYGVDYSEERIDASRKLQQYLKLDNMVKTDVGDVLALDYPDGFFDFCFANEILSHVKDLDQALSEISRTLKKGGTLFISDGNNSLSFIGNLQREKIQNKLEYGPLNASSSLPDTLLNMRKKLIRSKFKEIDNDTVSVLAEKTKGMYGEQITKACNEFINSKKIAEKADFPCRNPINGEKMEYPLNPFRLKNLLRETHGIESRILPLYATSPVAWKKLTRKIIRMTHPISLLISPEFELIGTKEQ
ncbi:MAG TPA: class I SAM-dependent methyltransferase [Nitrospirae bacterium]|nr:demethylmenaquinone methyltransferase [bacterium BMS3Abin06]HDH12909.1 class I SAM-dependent methyltransferase [Nitrospirota bacterium]HDZ01679.1 class I SAM-dependent methyltransferase [Nitrospirota bacterium]